MRVEIVKAILLKDRNGVEHLKTTVRKGRPPIVYDTGAVVTCSEATGKKWIEAGLAREVKTTEEAAPAAGELKSA